MTKFLRLFRFARRVQGSVRVALEITKARKGQRVSMGIYVQLVGKGSYETVNTVRSSKRAAVSFCSIRTSRTSPTLKIRRGPLPIPKARLLRAPTSGWRQTCRSRISQVRIFSMVAGESGFQSSIRGVPSRFKPQSSVICPNIVE